MTAAIHAQPRPVDATLERLRLYLENYEPKLSELVADEEFHQRLHPVPDGENKGSAFDTKDRRLASEFGFLRLPGNYAWLGQRSVRTIDGRAVPTHTARLDDRFVSAGPDLLIRAKAIADENALYNLGHARSMNVPTLPLELLGRQHAAAFAILSARPDTIAGRQATRISLREQQPGGIIAYDDRRFNRVDVVAWIRDADGAVLRAEVALYPPRMAGIHKVRVDFAPDTGLGLLVPVRLVESYEGRQRGDGTATYRNYRRFMTSGRMLPPSIHEH